MLLSIQLSAVLNWLRFTAALIVVLGHTNTLEIGAMGTGFGNYSHTMVILFFVMSGFIITRTTIDANLDFRKYMILRSSRVLIVAIPALLFSYLASGFLIYWIGSSGYKDEALYSPGPIDIFLNVLFLDHVWTLGRGVSLNPPFWSLTYEVWYYILFSILYFFRGWSRFLVGSILVVSMGPALLALMPVWFLGVLLCYMPKFLPFEKWIGVVVLCVMAIIPVCIVEYGVDLTVQNWIANQFPEVWRLGPSTKFLTDYLIGWSFFVLFWVVGSRNFNVNPIFVRWGVILAGFSFTLYLFHDPILRVLKFLGDGYAFSPWEHFLVILGTVILCWLISLGTESKTVQVRRYIERLQWQRSQKA